MGLNKNLMRRFDGNIAAATAHAHKLKLELDELGRVWDKAEQTTWRDDRTGLVHRRPVTNKFNKWNKGVYSNCR